MLAYRLEPDHRWRLDALVDDDRVSRRAMPLLRVADTHLYFGTDEGLEIFGEPEGFNNAIVRSIFRAVARCEKR